LLKETQSDPLLKAIMDGTIDLPSREVFACRPADAFGHSPSVQEIIP
jgi:hypothetical protein